MLPTPMTSELKKNRNVRPWQKSRMNKRPVEQMSVYHKNQMGIFNRKIAILTIDRLI